MSSEIKKQKGNKFGLKELILNEKIALEKLELAETFIDLMGKKKGFEAFVKEVKK